MLIPVHVSVVNPSLSYIARDSSNSNLTEYTFTGLSIGTVIPDRNILLAVGAFEGGLSITGVTMDGVAMIPVLTGASSKHVAGLYVLPAPTGTTADFVVTLSGAGAGRCCVSTHALVTNSLTPIETDTTNGADPLTLNLSVPGQSVAIGLGQCDSAALSTWTELVKDYDQTLESSTAQTTATKSYTTGGAKVITVDWGSSLTAHNAIAAVWG